MPEENTILYDGFIRDISDIPHVISGVNTTEDLKYEIAVYLDTSVGNDYQDLELIADNSNGQADYVWALGNDVSFDDCDFYTDGKAILLYSHGGMKSARLV